MQELELEQRLINQLTQGASQWTLREDIKNADQLWANFFKILHQNNKDRLADHPLTDSEKAVIKSKVSHGNFFDGAQWFSGANGEVHVQVARDDTALGTVDLLVVKNREIAGGNSTYEVIHQMQLGRQNALDHRRRSDVTLLINGIPLIHIELKVPRHPLKQAFNQIQKYIQEGAFSGLYSNVQMFVISNGPESRYFAANQQLNPRFLNTWVNPANQPVEEMIAFAKDVLSIPMAHRMVADYTVLDEQARAILLLRAYQIHAIERIRHASISNGEHERESGFVWHTTGSGKTLTSYKVARNLLSIPSIDKTVFLIDRKDLDNQTTQAFQIYANNDNIDVRDTASTYALGQKLASNKRDVIVTTRQKFHTLLERMTKGGRYANILQKVQNVRLAFIVDECHRAVSPDQKHEIDAFFHVQPLWYGFTGTPIFADNARQEKGRNARTTEQQYGRCLHQYTIKDAIRDGAVLGFQLDIKGADTAGDENDTKKMDQTYLSDQHMRAVVKQVLKTAYRLLGMPKRGERGYAYEALFSTSSISQAQKYYRLFQQLRRGELDGIEVPKRIKEVMPDFPRVAVTYSVADSQNGDDLTTNQDAMKEALADYNQLFGENFSLAEINAYNRDVNNRLARKQARYRSRDQQLDLVIVVDRLLTGFDAKPLSTLYLDRRPMNPQNLIQAFSRTNRIFDHDKQFGRIVTFQYPQTYEKAIDHALTLYANGGTGDVLAPTWAESKNHFVNAWQTSQQYHLAENGTVVADMTTEDLKQFVHDYRQLDRTLAAVQTYSEFDDDDLGKRVGLTEDRLDELNRQYEAAVAELKGRQTDGPDEEELIDDDYELESYVRKSIDYGYIVSLIQAYLPEDGQLFNPAANRVNPTEIDEYIAKLATTNQPLSAILGQLWAAIRTHPDDYRGMQVDQLLERMIHEAQGNLIQQFSTEQHVDPGQLNYVIANYNLAKGTRQQTGLNDLLTKTAFEAYLADHVDEQVKPYKWKKQVREDVDQLYRERVLPLIER